MKIITLILLRFYLDIGKVFKLCVYINLVKSFPIRQ